MNTTMQNKIMDLGMYLIGRNENINCGHRMIANPETCSKAWLSMLGAVLIDSNARRMALDLSRNI